MTRTRKADPAIGPTSYDPTRLDQFQESAADDVRPVGTDETLTLASVLAQQAVLYGMPAVLQYASMCTQCAPVSDGAPWTLNTLEHERSLARSDFRHFRVPNVDTVYSNAWLDLTEGPVTIDLPEFGSRYYTLEFVDAHSNVSNVSARTYPDGPRTIVVTAPGQDGTATALPSDAVVFDVPTLLMWILMRIQVHSGPDDIDTVRALQDSVVITGPAPRPRPWPVLHREDVESSAAAFLTALDTVVAVNGVPVQDLSHVHQFRQLNVGPGTPDVGDLDEVMSRGADIGFTRAMALLDSSRSRLGRRTASGWTRVLDKGAHGHNFVARAVMNFVGLGANAVEENCSYNTYVDSDGNALTGSDGHTYDIEFSEPPPAEAFWSVTLYDAETGWLYEAPGDVFSVRSITSPDGRVSNPSRIVIGHGRPDGHDDARSWLPAPARPFFLVLRMYRPHEDALTERWSPPPVHLADKPSPTTA